MKKLAMWTLLVMCLTCAGYAQEWEKEAKQLAKEKHNEMLNKLPKNCDAKLKNQQQFLISSDAVQKFGLTTKTMKDACSKLNDKSVQKITGIHTSTPEASNIKTQTVQKNKKTETQYYCTTTSEVTYKVKKNGVVSNAKYRVSFEWKVNVNGKGKVTGVGLENVKSNEIPYTSEEEKKMKQSANETAQKLIAEWYEKNTPSYFESCLTNETVEGRPVKTGEVKVSVGEPKKEITITKELPEVKVYVDRSQYEKKGEIFAEGDDGKAFYKFNNFSFKIKFTEDDFSKGEIVGDPSFDTIFHYPKTQEDVEADKKEAIKLAKETAKLFEQRLSNYLENPNKQTASELKSLFAKKSTIEISILTNNGTKRQKRTLDQYVAKIKGATVDIEMGAPQDIFVSEEPWKATVGFTQHTERKKYCDYTGKRILMVKDEKSGEFKISKIEVVNDATPCNQE